MERQPDKADESEKEAPGLGDRLLAAVLAPVIFNLSVLIAYAVIFHHRSWLRWHFNRAFPFNPLIITVLLVLPTVVGLMFGTNGVVNFLGHAFYTHSESKRDMRLTMVIWFGIAIAAYCVANAGGS